MALRKLDALETYNSDPEDEAPAIVTQPASKRRKILPGLPSTFASISHDDPSQHQGRTRSRPFVDGDYYAHLYISLSVSSTLQHVLDEVISRAQALCPKAKLHPIRLAPTLPLHVSLTHPLALRRSQLKDFENEIRCALMSTTQCRSFRLSLGGAVKVYYNGRRTGGDGKGGRVFMALRVGAGSTELSHLLDRVLHPILSKFHLPLYHSDPEFHTSFAWSLLRPGDEADHEEEAATDGDGTESLGENALTPVPPGALDTLNKEFGKAVLSAQPNNGWEIRDIELKIAKDVIKLPLHV